MNENLRVNGINLKKFMAALDDCKGNVYLIDDEGDRLNLKSKLCQLIGFSKIIDDGSKVLNAHFECDNPADEAMLFRLNLYGGE